MEASFTNTEVKPEKETPSKDLDAPNSVQDTEPTMTGTPRGVGLKIEIPEDDGNSSYSGSSVDLSDEETKGLTPAQEEASRTRTAIRLLRSATKRLAEGDSIDKEIAKVLEDLSSHQFIGRSYETPENVKKLTKLEKQEK